MTAMTAKRTKADLELIRRHVDPDGKCTDDQFSRFMHVADRAGLDPLANQIYLVLRWDRRNQRYNASIQTAIDGFRLAAARSGVFEGRVGPHWCGTDGKWLDVWSGKADPFAARVGIRRKGFVEPLFAVCRHDQYVPKNDKGQPTGLWGRMPDVMIGKCAEAAALRAAFPDALSGLYTGDEMQQADNRQPPAPRPAGGSAADSNSETAQALEEASPEPEPPADDLDAAIDRLRTGEPPPAPKEESPKMRFWKKCLARFGDEAAAKEQAEGLILSVTKDPDATPTDAQWGQLLAMASLPEAPADEADVF